MSNQWLEIDERTIAQATERLRQFEQPEMDKLLIKAVRAATRTFLPILQGPDTPIRKPGRGGVGERGDLRASMGTRAVRGEPLSRMVGPFGRRSRVKNLVVHGTRAHVVTASHQVRLGGRLGGLNINGTVVTRVHHPGSRPNPFIAGVGEKYAAVAREAMVKVITKAQAKL